MLDGSDTSQGAIEIPHSVNAKIDEVLGTWEEPEFEKEKEVSSAQIGNFSVSLSHLTLLRLQDDASISEIIQFCRSLSYLNTSYPFGIAFGDA